MTLAIIVGPNRIDREIADIIDRHDQTILIEPLPDACEFIASQIVDATSVRLVQAACGQASGHAVLGIYNRNGASSSLGICSAEMRQLYSGFDLRCAGTVEVRVINLGEFCREEGINRIDTLHVDAQGMDLAVLHTLRDWFRRSLIGWVQCEADGEGCRMYDGIPDNSEGGFDEFFSQFPQYKKSRVPDRVPWNPDLIWSL